MGSLACGHAFEGQRSTVGVPLCHSLPWFLKQALKVSLGLTVLARLAGQ